MATIIFYESNPHIQKQLEQSLANTGHVYEFVEEPLNVDNLNPKAEVISIFAGNKISRNLLEQMPELKLIACRSTGFDHVDLTAASEKGVSVVNVPQYGEVTVAEYTFALILSVARRLSESERAVTTNSVELENLRGFDLQGKTLGIIGTGRIGQHTAKIARGFGMEVIAYDVYPNEEKAAEIGFSYASLNDLAQKSDVISLHAPATRDTHHIVNSFFLEKVKPSAVLVNTARGELVDTLALNHALAQKQLASAALDVLEYEHLMDRSDANGLSEEEAKQLVAIESLKKMPNVIVTPHNAFNSHEAVARIQQTTVDNILSFLSGRPQNVVEARPIQPGRLMITRHCESEWNALGKWTGTTDVHITENGEHQAAQLGEALRDTRIDYAFASMQMRTLETLEGILNASGHVEVAYERSGAINERDYGDYTGMNKWEVRDKVGEEEFNSIRRNWDHPVPNGETLKLVYERAVPFYQQVIVPRLLAGENILIVSHGNTIRSLVKYIEDISDEGVATVEAHFGTVLSYEVDHQGKLTDKQEIIVEVTSSKA